MVTPIHYKMKTLVFRTLVEYSWGRGGEGGVEMERKLSGVPERKGMGRKGKISHFGTLKGLHVELVENEFF